MKNYTETTFNSTEYRKLEAWIPNVAIATLICAGLALSLVCYLVWLIKPTEAEEEQNRTRSRSRSNSSEHGGLSPFELNPIFTPGTYTRKVVMGGGSGSNGGGSGGVFAPVAREEALRSLRL